MYTDDKNAQIVLALLKKYNIRKIVISPGTANAPITRSIQADPFFEKYSVVDERSAAYFATGLAFESGEPVVISCTGATASRNYLPALTEAYYRNLPIIALTSQHYASDHGNLVPQITNRTISQIDVKRISINLPYIKDEEDEEAWALQVNKALTLATIKGGGPVHINLPAGHSLSFTTFVLPDIPKIDYYQTDNLLCDDSLLQLRNCLYGKKIVLFIGSHRKFSLREIKAVESFIDTYDVVVFYDQTSNYHGKNKVLIPVVSDLRKINIRPEIVVDIGGISGGYCAANVLRGAEFWRISEDGEFHQRYGNLRKQFDCPEYIFFEMLVGERVTVNEHKYFKAVIENIGEIKIPNLPLSNTLISHQVASKLPEGCSLHIGVSESLSCHNFFEFRNKIDSISNVGGYGIDGAVSTLVGQSMINKSRLYFAQVGDLTFFYDMNVLGNRHISNNLRILLVNNGGGARFRLSPPQFMHLNDEINEFIGAFGHNGSAEGWSKSMNFEYLTANTKDEFLSLIDDFCSSDINKFDKPVLFEVFTAVKNEQRALKLLRNVNRSKNDIIMDKTKDIAVQVLPKTVVNLIKKLKK